MILRLATVHENARSPLECGGLTPPRSALGMEAKGGRRRQALYLTRILYRIAQNAWIAGHRTIELGITPGPEGAVRE
jgi:hypothetical protein